MFLEHSLRWVQSKPTNRREFTDSVSKLGSQTWKPSKQHRHDDSSKSREEDASELRDASVREEPTQLHADNTSTSHRQLRRRGSHSVLREQQAPKVESKSLAAASSAFPSSQQPLRAPSQSRVRWKTSSAPQASTSEEDREHSDHVARVRAQRDDKIRRISEASRHISRLDDVIDLCNSRHTTVHSTWAPGRFMLLSCLCTSFLDYR